MRIITAHVTAAKTVTVTKVTAAYSWTGGKVAAHASAVAHRPETLVTAVMSLSYSVDAVSHLAVPAAIMAVAYVVEGAITCVREGKENKTS